MERKGWKWILVAGILVLALLLVWFYLPMHPKLGEDPEITVRYRNGEEFILTREQTEQVADLVEQLTCQRRVFLSRYSYPREEQRLCRVRIDWGDHHRIIELSIPVGLPEETVIDPGVRESKYLVLNAEPLLEEIEKIVKENEAARAADLTEDGTFWEILKDLQSATTEQKEMIVYDEAGKDITPVYLSSWVVEISKEPEDFIRYLTDQAQELIAVLPEEPEPSVRGGSQQTYTVLYYQEVLSSDGKTEVGFVFRARVTVWRESDGTIFWAELQQLQVASDSRGWDAQEANAELEVLEDGRVKGNVSYLPVPTEYYEPEFGLPAQYVSFWIQ